MIGYLIVSTPIAGDVNIVDDRALAAAGEGGLLRPDRRLAVAPLVLGGRGGYARLLSSGRGVAR